MANIVQYGLRPAAAQNNLRVFRFYCDGTNNSVALAVGDVVKAHSNGGVIASTADAILGNVGVVVGTFDTDQIPNGHPMSANASKKYLPATTVGYLDVALALPDAIFIGQSATVSYAATDIFASCDLIATVCDTTTGHSNHRLNSATTGAKDFIIMGLVNNPNNAWGAVNADVFVHFCGSIWGQGTGLGL